MAALELCSRMCLPIEMFLMRSRQDHFDIIAAQGLQLLNPSEVEPVCSSVCDLYHFMSPSFPAYSPPLKCCCPELHDSILIQKIHITGGVGAAVTLEPIPETVGMC